MQVSTHPLLQLCLVSLMLINSVMASSPLAPLGFALEATSSSEIRARLKGKGHVKSLGINRYSKGKMLKVAGSAFDVRGLKNVVFIFDALDQLTAVNLHMDKSQFNTVFKLLNEKYTLQRKQVPFVGNKSARFNHNGNSINMNSPHLSFSMQVTYETRKLEKAYRETLANERSKQRNKNKSSF